MIPIEDPEDERLVDYRHLNDPAARLATESERAIFMVEGRLAVTQLLDSTFVVDSLLVDDHQVELASELVEAVRSRGAPVFVGRRPVVMATVGFSLHRGVVAVARRPTARSAGLVLTDALGRPSAGGPPLVAVLEGLNDHENIGALFRNAAAFGVAGVLLDPTCADPLYRRSVRVSVGHVLRVPFARVESWPDALIQVASAGFLVAALAPHRSGPSDLARCSLSELAQQVAGSPSRPVALLLGAEGPGLSENALQCSDVVVSIPMASKVDSLNVATAAAVAFQRLSDVVPAP